MTEKLLLAAADLIERQSLGTFSQLSDRYDIAAYILTAGGINVEKWIQEGKPRPFFDQAQKIADLPNQRLLLICRWPRQWRDEEQGIWSRAALENRPPDRANLATLTHWVIRDYVEQGGWVNS